MKGSVIDLELGTTGHNHKYRLFTQTFLGFGANEARKRLILLLYHNTFKSSFKTQTNFLNKIDSIQKSSPHTVLATVVNPVQQNNSTFNVLSNSESSTPAHHNSQNFVNTDINSLKKKRSIQISIENPCLNEGSKEKIDLSQYGVSTNESVVFEGTGDLDKCIDLLNNLLNKTTCPVNKRCAMQGIIMPDINYR